MYHEGWWGDWYVKLAYLIPGAACLALTLIAIRWPKIGGWLIIIIGGAFTIFFMDIKVTDGNLTVERDIAGFLVSGPLVLIGILFLAESRNRKRRVTQGWLSNTKWWHRNFMMILAIAPPIFIFFGFSIYYLPILLGRVDDGNREARLIEGYEVTLIWAPEGPGWNWKQEFGGYPSWNKIALFGIPPVGMDDKPGYGREFGKNAGAEEMSQYNLCLYLSKDGLALMDEPQYIWRMPTVDEYLRSLTRHGENAGCQWNGDPHAQMQCDTLPDKETPLWAPDLAPIYYWASEEYNERDAYYVAYNGWVNTTSKSGGNPRHSFRCVQDP